MTKQNMAAALILLLLFFVGCARFATPPRDQVIYLFAGLLAFATAMVIASAYAKAQATEADDASVMWAEVLGTAVATSAFDLVALWILFYCSGGKVGWVEALTIFTFVLYVLPMSTIFFLTLVFKRSRKLGKKQSDKGAQTERMDHE